MDQQFKIFKDNKESSLTNSSLYRYCDNSWYRGMRQNRRRHGRGRLQLITGELYDGEFKQGLRHGFGIMKYGSPNDKGNALQKITEYKGDFVDDLKEGMASVHFLDGSKFTGQFKNDIQYGCFSWPPE